MPNLYLLFSHRLTEAQEQDAQANLKVERFIYLPDFLQNVWSNIPPEQEHLHQYLQPIYDFLQNNARPNDFVLVQGDFGATVLIVQFCWQSGFTPVYSTTKRVVKETIQGGKVQVERIFEHCRFREYEKFNSLIMSNLQI
jgi:hypothetical protein